MECQKHLFELPPDRHYLNCAYISPLLNRVEQAGIRAIGRKKRPWEITPDHFFDESHQLRQLFASLVGEKDPENIAIMPSVSYGMATVAKNLPTTEGKTILVAGEQFPSNMYAWMRFCRENACRLKVIDPPDGKQNRGEEWNRLILESIDQQTLMVAIGNVHWTDGTWFDVAAIGERARQQDAYLVIDGTQSVGALPFDVRRVQPDALICAGYKWLMGPYGIALGYFGPRFSGGIPLEEGWITRANSENFAALVDYEESYQPGAIRFDMGERSSFVLVPMMAEALKQVLRWGPAAIQNYCGELISNLAGKLSGSEYHIEKPDWRSNHLFGIRLPPYVDPHNLHGACLAGKVHVSIRGTAVRVSPHLYNDHRDLEALTGILAEQAG